MVVQSWKLPCDSNTSGSHHAELEGYCTGSRVKFSNVSLFLAMGRAAEIQCWFMAESNLILATLLPLSFKAVLVQDACTALPSFT